jgi:hypothetical protein
MSKREPIKILPSVEYLRTCFTYDPEQGELRWKSRPRNHFSDQRSWGIWNTKNAGTKAGSTNPGRHREVGVNRVNYMEHRVIFKLMTGAEPPESIDHIDGNPLNNRWSNLRPATHQEQKWNVKLRSDNTSGYRGVHRMKKKWSARINIHGEYRTLGCFATPEEASSAYELAARELHGKFYRGQT